MPSVERLRRHPIEPKATRGSRCDSSRASACSIDRSTRHGAWTRSSQRASARSLGVFEFCFCNDKLVAHGLLSSGDITRANPPRGKGSHTSTRQRRQRPSGLAALSGKPAVGISPTRRRSPPGAQRPPLTQRLRTRRRLTFPSLFDVTVTPTEVDSGGGPHGLTRRREE